MIIRTLKNFFRLCFDKVYQASTTTAFFFIIFVFVREWPILPLKVARVPKAVSVTFVIAWAWESFRTSTRHLGATEAILDALIYTTFRSIRWLWNASIVQYPISIISGLIGSRMQHLQQVLMYQPVVLAHLFRIVLVIVWYVSRRLKHHDCQAPDGHYHD